MENIDQIVEFVRVNAMSLGLGLLAAIATYIVGKWISKAFSNGIAKVMGKRDVDTTLIKFVKNLVYYVLLTVTILAALSHLGIETTSFVAILGAAGLAVGLALQGSLSNFAAGVLLIMFRPFKVGDLIEAGGALGSVKEISIFTTTLLSPENKTIIIPNSGVTGGNIVNYTTEGKIRVDMTFGIGYGDDIKKAKTILNDILNNDSRVLKDPAPFVGVSELGDSSVNFAVRPHVDPANYWGVFFDTHEKVKERFDAEGVSIPFPQRDIHLIKE